MTRPLLLLGLLAFVAACGDGQPLFDDDEEEVVDTDGDGIADPEDPDDDNDTIPDDLDPDDDGDGIPDEEEAERPDGSFTDTGGAGPIPADISGNLTNVAYDEDSDTLSVTIDSLDTTPVTATYERNEALDLPGYDAFSVQEDPLDRMFVALVRNSADGAVQGGVVADGGQFNTVFGGAFYRRTEEYSPHDPSQPDNGLVSYAGEYVGLTNYNTSPSGELLPVPDGVDPSLIPGEPGRVTGEVFLNADFADNAVNGAIYDRRTVGSGIELDDVILVVTDITGSGSFEGAAENSDQEGIGTYAGAFGGNGATAVAGGVTLQDYFDALDNEIEWGSFVLDRCGRASSSPICDLVEPDAP